MPSTFSFDLSDAAAGRAVAFELQGPTRAYACVLLFDRDGTPHAFRNFCPHWGVKLAERETDFFTRDGLRLRCAKHGAEFTLPAGDCVAGPCEGDRLKPLVVEIDATRVTVALPPPIQL